MILFRIFFFMAGFFFLLMFGLGIMVWLRLRLMGLHSFFRTTHNSHEKTQSPYNDSQVIEGEYTVIEQPKSDNTQA